MDVQSKEREANLALVLAVDNSGSMGRCHCDNPDLNQTYTARESGLPKVDIAKEAIMRSASALSQQDFLGVVAFDSLARWAFPVDPLPDQATLENAIGAIKAEGTTNCSWACRPPWMPGKGYRMPQARHPADGCGRAVVI